MAEIKSTLDIIMEKTRGLTLSEDEKIALHAKETERKIRGLFQKYLEGAIPMPVFTREWKELGHGTGSALSVLKPLCREQIDPLGENERFRELIVAVAGGDPDSMKKICDRIRNELTARRSEALERGRRALAESGVAGSAIQPNLNGDLEWNESLAQAKRKLCAALHSSL
jgi:hypothetical protein